MQKQRGLKNNMKKYTVSVGIPTYREESNLGQLLEKLIAQKQETYVLKDISVYIDGGSVEAKNIVEGLQKKYSIIKLINDGNRKGKYKRLEQFFSTSKSDIVINFDADIAPVGDEIIEKLVAVFYRDRDATIVNAHNEYIVPHNFVARVIHANFQLWENIRLSVPNYQSAANYYGTATAHKGSVARKMRIPDYITDPHLFLFLACKGQTGFRYVRDAVILQHPVGTIEDFKKAMRRPIGKQDKNLERIFKVKTEEIYAFSRLDKIKGVYRTFMWNPFYATLALLFTLFSNTFIIKSETTTSPMWEVTTSTKKEIKYEN